jgi:hypothetical protein
MPGGLLLLWEGDFMELLWLTAAIASGVIVAKTIKLYTNL